MLRLIFIIISVLALAACQVKSEQSPGGLISGHAPVTNSFTATYPASSTYVSSDVLHFKLAFPYAVTVTGTPRLVLNIGGSTVYANYTSSTGASILHFDYTVQASDNDSDGIGVATTIDLNGGTLSFTGSAGVENCKLSFAAANSTGILVDNIVSTISSVAQPANATYYVNNDLFFSLTFTKNVMVTGSPRLVLDVGGDVKYATYITGSGGKILNFKYTVSAADLDTNGIGVTSSVDLNGGTIKDSLNRNAVLTFGALNTTAVLVNGNTPYVSLVTPPANKTYGTGENLDFVFTFSEPVNVVGVPTVALTVGSTAKIVTYHTGSGTDQLTFRYAVQPGDVDPNGVASAATAFVYPAGSTIKDLAGTAILNKFTLPSLAGVIVADTRPTITSFQYTNTRYYTGQSVVVTALFNQVVTVTGTPKIAITLDQGGIVYATYVTGSGSSNLIFSYTVTTGVNDKTGILLTSPLDLNGGAIRNDTFVDANLVFTQPSSPTLTVDGVKATVIEVTPPVDKIYMTNDNIDIIVKFDEPVYVGNSTNVKLNLTVGATARQASYSSGSGTAALTFRYKVLAADFDSDGITVGDISVVSTGFINDGNTALANPSVLTYVAPTTPNVFVNLPTPTITSSSPVTAKTYKTGDTVSFTLNYSVAVTVVGNPRIQLTVGASTLYADFVSGSTTQNLVFEYTVLAGHSDTNGIAASTTLDNNGATIKSIYNVDANPAIPAQNLTAVLVDGAAPSILSSTMPVNKTYLLSDTNLTFTVTWNENVTKTGTPRLALTIGSATKYANYSAGDGTATFTFVYPIAAADLDLDGLAISSTIDLNGGTITDTAGNDAALSIGVIDLSKVLINYAGLKAWWDADDSSKVSTTVCGGDCTDQITDKSTAGNNLSAAGAQRPFYFSSGFGGANRAHLQFDDAGAFMNASTINPARTVFIAFQTEAAAMTAQGILTGTEVGVGGELNLNASGVYRLNGAALSGSNTTFAAGMAANTAYILAVQYDAGNNLAPLTLGDANFGGKIAEVLIYSTALSPAEIAAIVQYLNAKHSVY